MSDGQLLAGAARVCITPPVGVELSGYLLREQPSQGIHDNLYARALALDDGETRLCVVACDLVGLSAHSVACVRRAIASVCPHVMVTCTHTHAGPATTFLRHLGREDSAYLEVLLRQLAGTVRMACDNLQPARLGFGSSECHLAQCRRASRLPDGHPYDPEVVVLRVDRPDGRPIASVTNYACHAVVLDHTNRMVSADFPGATAAELERSTGAPSLFLQGACGDLNPRLRGGFAEVERNGRWLAGAALAAYHSTLSLSNEVRLGVATETLNLPLRPIPRDEVRAVREEALQTLSDASASHTNRRVAQAFLAWADDTLRGQEAGALPLSLPGEVQVFQLGEGYLASAPGELFVELGEAIKEGLGRGRTMVAAYANGSLGYLFTPRAAKEGGYEAATAYRYYGHYPVAADVGERIAAAAVRLGRG
ncbi:MAG: neutral/alkaline non-lysosomal ceramidase N-terminal domain-containing protein, partial [Armatimonadota bacterium]|nr:neutral/alkaline non-lysosomal ceramidase N-terminal domain-containing protein [Armatimonadota bacterium]